MEEEGLAEWVAILKCRDLPGSRWELEAGVESINYCIGEDNCELFTTLGHGIVELALVTDMTVTVPTLMGLAVAKEINSGLGRRGVHLEYDEDYVTHVVTRVTVGPMRQAGTADLYLAESEAKSLRDMFFRDALIASEATPKCDGNTPPWAGSE